MSYKRWPGGRSENIDRCDRQAWHYGSARSPAAHGDAASSATIDSSRQSFCLPHEGYRPPRRVADSSLVQLAGSLHLLSAGQLEFVERCARRFQMALRKMEIN